MRLASFALAALLTALAGPIIAQRPAGSPPLVSPEVLADGRVTFRLLAPKAAEVTVGGDFGQGRQPMTRDDQGVWSATVGPLAPELYSYSFSVDGMSIADPINPAVKLSPRTAASLFEVPAAAPQFFDPRPVPHGTVHIVWYESRSLGMFRSLYVYTPPGFEKGAKRLPVLYLLHGAGDTESEWVLVGRANLILDNLIADGKARPMVVVMPYGYAQPTVRLGLKAPSNPDRALFAKDLTDDVMPLVERQFRGSNRADERAIAGLSMGGGQALSIGLTRLDVFRWIAGFSSAIGRQGWDAEKTFPALAKDPASASKAIRLLWIGCGKEDGLFEGNQKFADWLTSRGVRHAFRATEGAHQWQVWRRYLKELAQQLFVR